MGVTRKQLEEQLETAKKERDEILCYLVTVCRDMGPITLNKRRIDEADKWTLAGEPAANGEAVKLSAKPRAVVNMVGPRH